MLLFGAFTVVQANSLVKSDIRGQLEKQITAEEFGIIFSDKLIEM